MGIPLSTDTIHHLITAVMTVVIFKALETGPLSTWITPTNYYYYLIGAIIIFAFGGKIARKIKGEASA